MYSCHLFLVSPAYVGFLGKITTNKASGGDGVPTDLFQILKDDTVNVLHSIVGNWKFGKFGKLSSGLKKIHRTEIGPFSFQSQRKAMTKNVQTTTQLQSSHMPAK